MIPEVDTRIKPGYTSSIEKAWPTKVIKPDEAWPTKVIKPDEAWPFFNIKLR